VDIEARTYNLDPNDIEKKITKRTKAIIAVHQIGLPADMKRIMAIAKKHNLRVIEDAACGLGAYIKNKHVGTFGDIAAFSFHPRKAITTAEGGLLITKNKDWLEMARKLRAHGASVSVAQRHLSNKVMHEFYPILGYNYRMSDIHAALGLSQIKKLDYMLKRRQELARNYSLAFSGHTHIVVPYVPPGITHSFQSYMIRLKNGEKIREKLMQKLLDLGIATRHGVMACHLEKPYRKLYPKLTLPVTQLATKETLILPLFPQMTQQEQTFVIDSLLTLLPTS
jgi:dTDP-4-amino-4,6-dideoxygalactose transaminase